MSRRNGIEDKFASFIELKKNLSKKIFIKNENKCDQLASEIVNLIRSILMKKSKNYHSVDQLSFEDKNLGWSIKTKDLAKAAKSLPDSVDIKEVLSAFDSISPYEKNRVVKSINHLIAVEQLYAIEKRKLRIDSSTPEQIQLCRREAGSYYTPEVIVDYIVKSTLGPKIKGKGKINLNKLSCFDPAMGTGNFLVGAIKFLAPILAKRNQISIVKAQKLIAENCVFGSDIDKEAIKAAIDRICNITGVEASKLKNNFLVTDGLDFVNIEKHFTKYFGKNSGFEFVIGNPPYVDYRKINSSTKQYLRLFKSCQNSGKVNLYIPFIEACVKNYASEGSVGLIVPNQWLANNQGTQLRSIILPSLTRIVDISNVKIFEDADTYPVIIFANNEMKNTESISVASVGDTKGLKDSEMTFTDLRKDSILKNDGYKIKTNINSDLEVIWSKLKTLPKLEQFTEDFRWGTSQSGYGKLKISLEILKNNFNMRPDYLKMLQTADIKRMNIEWKQEFLPKSVFTEAQLARFKKKKLVIARLTKSIQCAYDDKGFALGKASFITHPDEDFLKALTVILSSTLISTWFRDNFTSVHMAGGYLRYDIPYLKQIPIPALNKSEIKRLSLLHDKHQRNRDLTIIDNTVNELYGISEVEENILDTQFKKAA